MPSSESLRPRTRRRRLLPGVATGVVALLLTGYGVHTASADEAPITLTADRAAEALLGPAVRVTHGGADYSRTVVATAELLDWREAHPAADQATIDTHLADVNRRITEAVPNGDALLLEPAELLGRQLRAVYDTPGAVIIGPRMTDLLGVVTTRDVATVNTRGDRVALPNRQRLSGAYQRWGVAVPYAETQQKTWSALRAEAASDPVLAGAWRTASGVDPTWTAEQLAANVAPLRAVVDVPALRSAAGGGADKFFTELRKQLAELTKKLNDQQDALSKKLEELLTTAGVPGKPGERGPTADQLKKATEEQKTRQGAIDLAKSGMDALVWIATAVDPAFGKQLGGLVETTYKVVTLTNQLVSAVMTLASSTGVGASTFGVIGAAVGAGIGLLQVIMSLSGSDGAAKQADAGQQSIEAMNRGFADLQTRLQQIYTVMNERFDRVDRQLRAVYTDMMTQFGAVLTALRDLGGRVDQANARLVEIADRLRSVQSSMVQLFQASAMNSFSQSANVNVDFRLKNGDDPSTAEYRAAANEFQSAGSITATSAVFRAPNTNDADVLAVLATYGTDGSVDYLLQQARNRGIDIPRAAGDTPNSALWAVAARAYTLLAVQNPDRATADGLTRISELAQDGRLILDNSARLRSPELFAGLLQDNQTLQRRVATALGDIGDDAAAVPSDRPYRLWDTLAGPAISQRIDTTKVNLVGSGPTVTCPRNRVSVPRPAEITGSTITPEMRVAAYVAGNWTFGACRTQFSEPQPKYKFQTRNGGPNHPTVVIMTKTWSRSATFDEYVDRGPGKTPVKTGTIRLDTGLMTCTAQGTEEDPPTDADCIPGNGPEYTVSTTAVPGVGQAQAQEQINLKRKAYFQAITRALADDRVPAVTALNENVRQLQAYSVVAYPRARESDEQFSALLFGTHALPANLPETQVLTQVFTAATAWAAENKAGMAEQPLLGTCIVNTPGDPVLACLSKAGQERQRALGERYTAIAASARPEGAPMVEEALRNLELVQDWVRARKAR